MKHNAEFSALFSAAHAAGMAALLVKVPTPMIVKPGAVMVNCEPVSDETYYVPDGMCGFAWISIAPATCAFAKWLKASGRARGGNCSGGSGTSIWVSEGNQSYEKKMAYARAFADVLKAANLAGVKSIYADGRLD